MRYFLLMCLAVFIVVQALGRTQLSEESPEVNSENLLVLLAPLVFIYGVSLFLTILDQMVLPARELRYLVKIAFVGLCCAPMIFVLLPPNLGKASCRMMRVFCKSLCTYGVSHKADERSGCRERPN